MPINGTYTPYDLERVNQAIDYIHGHYTNSISADQLSLEVSLDIKLLQALMQVMTGLTVHNYLVKVRVDRATEDLSDFKKSIKFIALTHGFSSSSHFGREFKRQTGITPKGHRFQIITTGKCLR
jgi:AraC-like DNA-binding protein